MHICVHILMLNGILAAEKLPEAISLRIQHNSHFLFCRKFDFFPKGTAGADGWMSLYFKFADQFSDNQQIGFGFKLHVINFQFPSQTLTKGMGRAAVPCCGSLLPSSCSAP